MPSFRALLMPVLLVLAAGLGGCDTDGGADTVLGDLVEPLLPPTPGEAARDAFNVYDPDKRRESIALLSAAPFGSEAPYVRMYRLLLDDPDPTVRAASVKALGIHGEVDDAERIIPRLSDSAAYVRWEAAQALQRIHSPAAAAPLVGLLQTEEDTDVRMAAATALGQYPQPAVFDALVGALTDRNYGVVQAAVASLETLTGQSLGIDPGPWVSWSNERRDRLFAEQRPFSFQPYSEPPGWVDKMKFWKDADSSQPQAPVGLAREGDAAS